MDFIKVVLLVSLVAFIGSVALYMNPLVSRLYQSSAKTGTLKTWKSQPRFLFFHFLIVVIETSIFVWVFSSITMHYPITWLSAGLWYGLFLFLIRILPRFFDMFMMVNYPIKLLLVELINGGIFSLIMSLGISYFLYH